MIRIGFVSSVGSGGVSVTYPDTGKTTAELPVLAFAGLKQSFEKDDAVVVAHMSNDNSTAVVLGKFYAGDIPKAELMVKDGKMTLSDTTGSISVAEIIAK
nr:MAG TPA: Pvc8, Photorhabdus asymbiotica, PVC, contractile.9A [Caudoviricetes sp.]